MSDNPNAPSADGTPATSASPSPSAVDHTARLVQLENELRDFKVRDGRYRNEKGVMQARIRELEQLALSNTTGVPGDYGQPSYTQTPYEPAYSAPQPANVVSREEFDLWRAESALGKEAFQKVKEIALDGSKVGQFLRYVPGADGRAVASVYETYNAIHSHLQAESDRTELAALRAKQSPQRNPALGTISGTSAAAPMGEVEDIHGMTPEQIKEKYPEAFPDPSMFNPNPNWGK